MERRSLIDGLKATPQVDSEREKEFVHRRPSGRTSEPVASQLASLASVPRMPISTRMRVDLAEALKRASLQRQLDKVEPSTLIEILEQAVEPWLKSNGYLN